MGVPKMIATKTADTTKTASNKNARVRLSSYKSRMGRFSSQEKASEAAILVPLLALQSYHLPGNNWRQDWCQYMANNHPLFGIFFHHPLHPIGACTRIVALIGSFIFGLVMTNCFYLFYLIEPQFNQFVMDLFGVYTLTTGMLLLWTLGGCMHTAYNLLMWHIAACACCRSGGCCQSKAWCPSLGKHLLRYFVFISLGLAVLIVLLRVAITDVLNQDMDEEAEEESSNLHFEFPQDDEEWDIHVNNAHEFQFVLGYLVEMTLALFIYYPLGGTILFSGVLGCGKIPLLGGRPAEVAAEERRNRKQRLCLDPTTETNNTLELSAKERRQQRNELRELRLSAMHFNFPDGRNNDNRVRLPDSPQSCTVQSTTSSDEHVEEEEECDTIETPTTNEDIELVWAPGAILQYSEDRACEV